MIRPTILSAVVIALASGIFGASTESHAQAKEITLQKIDVEFDKARSTGRSSGRSKFKDAEWMIVSVEYDVEPFDNLDWLNDVEFRVFIEGLDELDPNAQGGTSVILSARANYALVPKDKGLVCSFYVHPMVVARYGGDRHFKSSRKRNIRFEVYQRSRRVDGKDMEANDRAGWWTEFTNLDGFVLPKDQTPFRNDNVSATPPLRVDTRR